MKKIISIILILFSQFLNAQDQPRDGEFFLERKGFLEAISIIEPIFQKNPTQKMALQLANAFFKIKKYEKSLSYYETALSMGEINEEQMAEYFSALYEYGDLELARKIALDYRLKYGKKNLIAKIDSAENYKKQDQVYFCFNLNMNSSNNEYGMYNFRDKYKFVNSDVFVNSNIESNNNNINKYLNPYLVDINDTAKEIPSFISLLEVNNKYHDVISHYDDNEKKVYITRSNMNKNNLRPNKSNLSTLKIYISSIDSNFVISNFTEFPYNSNDYSCGHPCVSRDGEILYFVSDKPGGFGGTDIYRCMKLNDGTWGFPINLGKNINTAGDEMFPYISPQGSTLYFSSTGHSIFGGLDLNKSQKTRYHAFLAPENLGIPFNSSKDDFAINFSDNYGTEGFFTSNRAGGKGGDDIYMFSYFNNKVCMEPVKNFKMIVIDKKTKQRIQNVHLKMTVKLDNTVHEDNTDANGEVNLTVEGCYDFDVEATHDLYLNNNFYYDGFKKSVTIELDKKELNNIIGLDKIYYDLGKSDVHPAAAIQLNKLAVLLKKNLDIKVELSSHTDSRGEDFFNLELSQKRADQIVKYLVLNGVNSSQLVAKGYGETKLVNECGNNITCTEEMHEKNRRTEFKILEIKK